MCFLSIVCEWGGGHRGSPLLHQSDIHFNALVVSLGLSTLPPRHHALYRRRLHRRKNFLVTVMSGAALPFWTAVLAG